MADSSKHIQLHELKDMITYLKKMIKPLKATVDATNKREEAPAAAKAEDLKAFLPDKIGKKRKAWTTDAERFKGIPVQKKYLDLADGEQFCPVCNTAQVFHEPGVVHRQNPTCGFSVVLRMVVH